MTHCLFKIHKPVERYIHSACSHWLMCLILMIILCLGSVFNTMMPNPFNTMFTASLANADEISCIFDNDGDGDVDGLDLAVINGAEGYNLNALAMEFGRTDCLDDSITVAVPDLSGQSREAAESTIFGSGLIIGDIISVYSATIPFGIVVGQNPAAGSFLLEGSMVALYISDGPEPEDPLPQGSFGGTYKTLIPGNAQITAFNPERFAMITGIVQAESGNGLAGVSVAVLDHPEYGTVSTDADGRFSIAVNGGGILTVKYTMAGFMDAQRAVDVPWKDFAITKATVLLPRDTVSSTVTLDGNPDTPLVHVGSSTSDDFGERSPVVVLSGDTMATAVHSDGSTTDLSGPLTIRATEFPTPESMPAILPPSSAFTYCVALSIDQAGDAHQVQFSKPVTYFLRNFIGFDVGETIPVGYYDELQGKWLPEPDGRVVRLLDTDEDGVIDALDADGDNLPDDLDQNGNFEDEVFGITLAGEFSPGDTVWRTRFSHFSIMDLNLSVRPPSETAILPNPMEKPDIPNNFPVPPCTREVGSRIDEREQVFHEDLPLAGSDYLLHYSSNRVRDYFHKINVPVSGDQIPASVNKIMVELQVAGNLFTKELAPSANLSTQFVWDGLDVFGIPVTSTMDATISIGYVYTPTYLGYSSDMIENYGIQQSFALPGDYVTAIARDSMAMWKVSKLALPVLPAALETAGLGNGWSLTPHHSLLTGKQKILARGDGTTKTPPEGQNLIWTFAGNGTGGYTPPSEPIPATDGELWYPCDLDIDSKGNIYILDKGYIRKVDAQGMMTVIAGDGTYNYSIINEGGLASETPIQDPRGMALGPDGSLYVCVYTIYGFLVRRISPEGIITTVAGDITTDGGAVPGWNVDGTASPGDGGPATSAYLHEVSDIEVGPDGSIYISQAYDAYIKIAPNGNVIRKVDPNGMIQTIAGRGPQACIPDVVDAGIKGVPALESCLTFPEDLSLDTSGNLLMAIPGGASIVNLGSDGLIRTLAGCYGSQICNEEMQVGEPARQCSWHVVFISGVLAAPDGSFYVSVDDWRYTSSYILKVDSTGMLQLFAGQLTSASGYTGDNGPALDALLSYHGPYGTNKAMVLDPEGYLYVTDYANHVVRKIGPKFGSMHPMVNAGEIMIPECPDCPDYGGTGHIFDMGGKHLRTMDLATGKTIYEFLYDAGNHLIGISDQFGSVTAINRDGQGKAVSITSPYGDVTQLAIDTAGNLVQVLYPDSEKIQIAYTGSLLTSKIDRENQVYSYAYDADGRFVSSMDPSGGGITLGIQKNMAQGRTTTVTTVTTAEGRVNTYEGMHDSSGTFSSTITGQDGSRDVFSLSPDGFSTQRIQANGTVLSAKKLPDPLTGASYTALTKITTPMGLEKTSSVLRTYGSDSDNDSLPDTITTTGTVNGLRFTEVKDISLHHITLTSPESRVITRNYDPDTLLINSLSVPGLTDIAYGRDTQGRVKTIAQGDRQTTYDYTGAWLSAMTNDLGQTTAYTRDLMGHVTGLQMADASSWAFERDGEGLILTLTEPDNTTKHRFTHTLTGLPASYTSPMGAVEYYSYDKDKLPVQREYPSGRSSIWQYNTKGQLTGIQTPEASHSFSYDAATGLLSTAVSGDGQQVDFTYDGNLLIETAWTGIVSGSITREYDNFFRMNRMAFPGADLSFTYDGDGLLTGVGSIDIIRNAANGLVSQITDGSYTIGYGWNTFGEITSKTITQGPSLYDITYTRDDLGRISQMSETVGGTTHIIDYEYDNLGQLTRVKQDGNTIESYGYNSVGNRIILNNTLTGQHLSTTDHTYDADNKLLSAGSTTYNYDADGRLAQENQNGALTQFSYNTDGTLASVTLPDNRVISYLHDIHGRRIARAVDGIRTHAWIYGDGLMPLAEFDGAGSLEKSFLYVSGATPTAFIKGGQTFHIVSDHLGSPRLIVDSTGAVVRRIDYDTFGNVLNDTNPGMDLPFGFAGGMADPDHELVRFGARDYQPSTGRWTAKDPILFNDSLTLYGYVDNDPMNWVDRFGKGKVAPDTSVEGDSPQVGVANHRPEISLPDKSIAGKVDDDGTPSRGAEVEGVTGYKTAPLPAELIAKGIVNETEDVHGDSPAGPSNHRPASPPFNACEIAYESDDGQDPTMSTVPTGVQGKIINPIPNNLLTFDFSDDIIIAGVETAGVGGMSVNIRSNDVL